MTLNAHEDALAAVEVGVLCHGDLVDAGRLTWMLVDESVTLRLRRRTDTQLDAVTLGNLLRAHTFFENAVSHAVSLLRIVERPESFRRRR